MSFEFSRQEGIVRDEQGVRGRPSRGLENRCPKGLVGSSPSPSAHHALRPRPLLRELLTRASTSRDRRMDQLKYFS